MSALKTPKNGVNTNSSSGNNLSGIVSKKTTSLTVNNLKTSTSAFHNQNHSDNQDEGTLRVRIKMLEDDLARRQESYVRDERLISPKSFSCFSILMSCLFVELTKHVSKI